LSALHAGWLCYLCGQAFVAGEYTEHYNECHLPRLLVPAGLQAACGATVRDLFQQSVDAPALMADLLVLLHHSAAEISAAREHVETGGGVGSLLASIDDAVALLVLARQTVVDAVGRGGIAMLHGPGDS
jgi:hypothetical protein